MHNIKPIDICQVISYNGGIMLCPTSLSLTDRDLAVLRMVYEYDGCAIDHIRLRFFPTSGARTPCYRRIAHLIEHAYLASNRLPSLTGRGSGKAFLTIGSQARSLLAQVLELSRSELARTRMSSPLFIAHHLALCDLRSVFEAAAIESPLFTLRDWLGDRELHQSPMRVKDSATGQQIPIVPDSSFTLVLPNGGEQTFLVEMDMATVAPKRMQAKLRAYLARSEDHTPVLFIVPNRARQDNITRWALREAQDLRVDPTIFWITTKDVLTPETVLSAPIWQVVGGPTSLAVTSLIRNDSDSSRRPSFAEINTQVHIGGVIP